MRPFQAAQRSVKIKIKVSFFSSTGIGTERVTQMNCFRFLILVGALLVILICCMIFLSRFLDIVREHMSTVFSLYSQTLELFPYRMFSFDLDLNCVNRLMKRKAFQNSQTHFKNPAAFAARFLKCVCHFGMLCIKGLSIQSSYPTFIFELVLSSIRKSFPSLFSSIFS